MAGNIGKKRLDKICVKSLPIFRSNWSTLFKNILVVLSFPKSLGWFLKVVRNEDVVFENMRGGRRQGPGQGVFATPTTGRSLVVGFGEFAVGRAWVDAHMLQTSRLPARRHISFKESDPMLPDFTYTLLLPAAPDEEALRVFAHQVWPGSAIEGLGIAVSATGTHTGRAMAFSAPYPPASGVIAQALEGDMGKASALGSRAHVVYTQHGLTTREARMEAFARLGKAAVMLGAQWAVGGPGQGGLLPIGRYADKGPLTPLGGIGRVGSPLPVEMGGGVVLSTRGLSLFTGYELGFPAQTAEKALGCMDMALMVSMGALLSPGALKEGDTVSVSPTEIRHVRVWDDARAGVPVMVLNTKPWTAADPQ